MQRNELAGQFAGGPVGKRNVRRLEVRVQLHKGDSDKKGSWPGMGGSLVEHCCPMSIEVLNFIPSQHTYPGCDSIPSQLLFLNYISISSPFFL